MWTVTRPDFEVDETFELCISKIKNVDLRERLRSVTGEVANAASQYAIRAGQQELHLFPQDQNIAGDTVTGEEMISVYSSRMVPKKGPGRRIYDAIKLLPKFDLCPFCDHSVVTTLDHVLPKQLYPILAVSPDNLVGCCKDCNTAKLAAAPQTAADAVLHPYFDDISNERWLAGQVVEGQVAVVMFRTIRHDGWSDDLNDRIENQFRLLNLRALYSKQAARTMSGHKEMLIALHNNGGAPAVRTELIRQYESWRNHQLNCWQTTTYQALSESDWYCNEGHRL